MTDGSWSIPKDNPNSGFTYKVIQDWLKSGIPASKIILALTTNGLEAYMVDWIKGIIQQNGMAGASGGQVRLSPQGSWG